MGPLDAQTRNEGFHEPGWRGPRAKGAKDAKGKGKEQTRTIKIKIVGGKDAKGNETADQIDYDNEDDDEDD